MATVDLNDKERSMLTAAFVRAEMAMRDAEAARQKADQAERLAQSLANEARGVVRTILELRNYNPAAYLAKWDGSAGVELIEKLPPGVEANQSQPS